MSQFWIQESEIRCDSRAPSETRPFSASSSFWSPQTFLVWGQRHPDLRLAFSLRAHSVFPLCMLVSVSQFPFCKNRGHIDEGPSRSSVTSSRLDHLSAKTVSK